MFLPYSILITVGITLLLVQVIYFTNTWTMFVDTQENIFTIRCDMDEEKDIPPFLIGWDSETSLCIMAYDEETQKYGVVIIPLRIWDGFVEYVRMFRPPNHVMFDDPAKLKKLPLIKAEDINLKDFFFP
jgi:hypothetical protein